MRTPFSERHVALGSLFLLFAGCGAAAVDPSATNQAVTGSALIPRPLPPIPVHEGPVPAHMKPTPPPGLPPGCTSSTTGLATTTSCLLDQTTGTVPLHWTLTRTTYTTPLTLKISPRLHTIEITNEITNNGQRVVRMQRRLGPAPIGEAPSTESVLFDYGPSVHGLAGASLTITNGTVSGSVDGRAIVPFPAANGISGASMKYTDGKPAPVVTMDPGVQSALQALMAQPLLKQAMMTGSVPVPENGGDETDQNTLDYWATDHCQQCQKDCAESWENWICPPCLVGCMASCFIPGRGCMENHCGGISISSCDSGHDCCGDICCDSNEVCGNDHFGACCPKEQPVGCGDVTTVWCYEPGSTCCGIGTDACPPGTTCQFQGRPGEVPNCCPNDKACDGACCSGNQACERGPSGKGVCCDHALCGDECCGAGELCNNGKCGFGTICGNDFCGFGQQCCNGSCCTGTCVDGNLCCGPSQVVCGSACCAEGQICADAGASRCAAPATPTLTLYNTVTNQIQGRSGGPPAYVTNSMNIIVKGESFAAGSVSLWADQATGTPITTAPVSNGQFSTTIGLWVFSGGAHKLVATDGAQTVSVDLQVTVLH